VPLGKSPLNFLGQWSQFPGLRIESGLPLLRGASMLAALNRGVYGSP